MAQDRPSVILWCDGDHDPATQMRRDAALLARLEREAAAGLRPAAVLRLFRFVPHGITLGYRQRPGTALDLDACREAGVTWAVRPTGGRAIFHAEEWTYALAAAIDDPVWGGDLARAYDTTSRLVLASLRRLGVPVHDGRGHGAPHGDEAHPACFASTARHEILRDGRKLVGSAQRRGRHALLQQGSVLLGEGHLRLAAFLALPPAGRASARAALAASAAHAGDVLGADAPLSRWADALAAELGPGVGRVDGASGRFLLTLQEVDSYTSAFLHTTPE